MVIHYQSLDRSLNMHKKRFLLVASLSALATIAISSCSISANPTSVSPSSSTGGASASESTSVSYEGGDTVSPRTDVVSVSSLPAKARNFYQLLVYSFADGDGDGIGDFKGIIDHLDYLEDLGIGGLWLSPIHEAKSYHAYDVIDYYSVNSRYEVSVDGKSYTLDTLLSECHKRGIKVILDLVLNHSSSSCSWYKDHPEWYSGKDAFGGDMKDFDYDNKSLRAEIKNVGKYWLDKGVDGFRLDAAKWIYNEGAVNGKADDEKNYAWWQEFYEYCKGVKNDVYVIQEILTEQDNDVINYYKTTMDGDFDFDIRPSIYKAARRGQIGDYLAHLQTYLLEIHKINQSGILSSVISNHDIGRFQNYNKRQGILEGKALAFAGLLNVLAPGDSYVYYGDELGMDGTCSNTREGYYEDLNFRTPMPFSSGRTVSEKYLYSSVPGKSMTTSTYKNETPENSTFKATYRKAIQAKNRAPMLYQCEVEAKPVEGDSSLGFYLAKKGNDRVSVLFNASSSEKKMYVDGVKSFLGEAALEGSCSLNGKALTMAPYSAALFEGEIAISNVSGGSEGEASDPSDEGPIEDDFGHEVNNEVDGSLTIHCLPPSNWKNVNCYAWVGQNQYFGGWPGKAMIKEGNVYTITIPHGASNIIFSNGSDQTVNLYRNKEGEYWFAIDEGTGKSLSGAWYLSDPS